MKFIRRLLGRISSDKSSQPIKPPAKPGVSVETTKTPTIPATPPPTPTPNPPQQTTRPAVTTAAPIAPEQARPQERVAAQDAWTNDPTALRRKTDDMEARINQAQRGQGRTFINAEGLQSAYEEALAMKSTADKLPGVPKLMREADRVIEWAQIKADAIGYTFKAPTQQPPTPAQAQPATRTQPQAQVQQPQGRKPVQQELSLSPPAQPPAITPTKQTTPPPTPTLPQAPAKKAATPAAPAQAPQANATPERRDSARDMQVMFDSISQRITAAEPGNTRGLQEAYAEALKLKNALETLKNTALASKNLLNASKEDQDLATISHTVMIKKTDELITAAQRKAQDIGYPLQTQGQAATAMQSSQQAPQSPQQERPRSGARGNDPITNFVAEVNTQIDSASPGNISGLQIAYNLAAQKKAELEKLSKQKADDLTIGAKPAQYKEIEKIHSDILKVEDSMKKAVDKGKALGTPIAETQGEQRSNWQRRSMESSQGKGSMSL